MIVTEQRQREALVQRKATTDALTGTWNRGVLFDALQQHLDPGTGRGCALLFCDVDEFKAVNDQHGHARGDQLLVEVAARLLAVAGPEGLVARFGGDEFVVLLPDVDASELAALVGRVHAGMQQPLQDATTSLSFSISIGAAHGRPGEDPDHVLAMADQSMYSRKRRRTAR
jgi:diguanylate cyclase (GGDEF)-like protein